MYLTLKFSCYQFMDILIYLLSIITLFQYYFLFFFYCASFYCVLQTCHFFYKLKVCASPEWNNFIGAIFFFFFF